MSGGKKARAWWAKLGPHKQAELRRLHRSSDPRETPGGHHGRDDLACPACGTDSSVGCIAGSGR